jgi:transposase-like protein
MEPTIEMVGEAEVELPALTDQGCAEVVDVCREHDLKQSDVESWMEAFLKAGERGLKAKSVDEVEVRDREVNAM